MMKHKHHYKFKFTKYGVKAWACTNCPVRFYLLDASYAALMAGTAKLELNPYQTRWGQPTFRMAPK